MIEYWKKIKNYPGYEVSNTGRIKSLGNKSNHKNEIIMKQSIVLGYSCVTLRKDGKAKMLKVHRLVGEAFIPNNENKKQINHKDGNKLNNYFDNLEWCTPSENIRHAFNCGLKSQLKGIDNPKSIKILMCREDGEAIKKFGSLREAERIMGFPHGNIMKSIKRNGTCGGYKWRKEI